MALLPSLSPVARRVLGAAVLCAGVFVVGGQLRGSAPRDVAVRLDLGPFVDASRPVRAVDVVFSRDGAPVRALHRELPRPTPREWTESTTLPEARLRARVTLTLDALVLEREGDVTVAPGEVIALPAPAP